MNHLRTKKIEPERLILRRFTIEDAEKRYEISDETIDYIGVLAKLELSVAEKELAKKDMKEMLHYISRLNELDTEETEPMSHIFPSYNVFREDVIVNGDTKEQMLSNAPERTKDSYIVPKTLE